MTFFYFSATRSTPSAQKCGGASPSGGVSQSVHSQPQTARKAPSHTRTHPERKAPEKDKQKAQRRTNYQRTHQPTNTAHNGRPKHGTPHQEKTPPAEPPAVDVYEIGTPPPDKSKRKAPRRTGAHDVIFLIGLLEDFTQQNERKKNNTHDQKHFYTSSILSLWINTA